MEIRQAFPNEVNQIMTIIDSARDQIATYGSNQWQSSYPTADIISEDILLGQGYVSIVEGNIVAYVAVIDGKEPAYDAIYDGQWLQNNQHYITFHRMAVSNDSMGLGICQTFLQGLIEGHTGPDFRIDTHEKNEAMKHIVDKLGFIYCGKVRIEDERLAYQKIKEQSEKALYQEVDESDYHGF